MELRTPTPDPSNPAGRTFLPAGRADQPEPDPFAPEPRVPVDPDTPVAWRVDRRLTIGKIVGAVVFGLAAVIGYPDLGQVLVVGLAAVLLVALAVRDLAAPVRLAADPTGVTIATGLRGHRHVGWDGIDTVRVDARRGVLLRSQVLELDAGEDLYFFSVNELGEQCEDVAERLLAMRARHRPGATP